MRPPSCQPPTLCVIGGCNGAGKSTFASELLPRIGVMRFLNSDEIARGLSPFDPSLAAFRAGRLFLAEFHDQIRSRSSFAIESTLSGRIHVALLKEAKTRGFRIVLHYLILDSVVQAIERVKLRVRLGGHDVPEDDIARRYYRSLMNFAKDYLPLADAWSVWDNAIPPASLIADDSTHTREDVAAMIASTKLKESTPLKLSELSSIGLEASRAATEKMLAHYKRMGLKVTSRMTLAPEGKNLKKRKAAP